MVNAAAVTSNVQTRQWQSRYVIYLDGERRLVLPVGPEETQQQDPSRTSTVNTLAGAYLESWGAGVGSYLVAGTTGYRELRQGEGDGWALIQAFWKLHRDYQNRCATKDPASVELLLIVPPYQGLAGQQGQDPTTEVVATPGSAQGVYRVASDSLETDRNKADPLLWRYRWSVTILEDRLNPAQAPGGRYLVSSSQPDSVSSGSVAQLAGALTNELPGPLPNPGQATPPGGSITIPGPPPGGGSAGGLVTPAQAAALIGVPQTDMAAFLALNGLRSGQAFPASLILTVPPKLGLI